MKTSRKLLICAAVSGELGASRTLSPHLGVAAAGAIIRISDSIDAMTYGVGMFQAGYHTAKAISGGAYGLVLAAGIAGAYSASAELGTAVMAGSAAFADCATENPDGGMCPVVGSGFVAANGHPFSNGAIHSMPSAEIAKSLNLPCVRANTVNRICTQPAYLNELLANFPAEIETMESAAVAYTCAMQGVNYAEIRGISNHTVQKSKGKWTISQAIEAIGTILDNLTTENFILLEKYLN